MPRKGTSLKLEYKTQKELYDVSDIYACDCETSQCAFQNETVPRVSFVD